MSDEITIAVSVSAFSLWRLRFACFMAEKAITFLMRAVFSITVRVI